MYDLVLKGGKICTAHDSYFADVGVVDGKIVEISNCIDSSNAREVVDAAGLLVLPGVWHTHCHFRDPGVTNKEDFESGSKLAAAGGITFVIDSTFAEP